MAPTELLMRFARIAQQLIDLSRPEVARVYAYDILAGLAADADFVASAPAPFDVAPDVFERKLHELAHRVHFARRQNKVTRRRLLQNPPHPIDVIARMSP